MGLIFSVQSLLGDQDHRLLSAARSAKMAVVYSQFTSLYVLTNAVSCSSATQLYFLHDANEVFNVNTSGVMGLLLFR